MPIRRYQRDPRTEAQRRADEELVTGFERGVLLRVAPAIEKAAIESVTRRRSEHRTFAARLGVQLGLMRRSRGISQRQLARVLGTTNSNVSRLERGRDGGVTLERLLAVEEAIRSLAGPARIEGREERLIRVQPLDRFQEAIDCLETA